MKDFSEKTTTKPTKSPQQNNLSPQNLKVFFCSKVDRFIHRRKNPAYARTSLFAARPCLALPVTNTEPVSVATGGSQKSSQESRVEMLPFLLCVAPGRRVPRARGKYRACALRALRFWHPRFDLAEKVGSRHWRQGAFLSESQSTGCIERKIPAWKCCVWIPHRGLKGVSALVCRLLYDLPSTFTDASFSSSDNLFQGPEKWVCGICPRRWKKNLRTSQELIIELQGPMWSQGFLVSGSCYKRRYLLQY